MQSGSPTGTADCLQGNLCWALTALGCTDSRLKGAFEWLARSVTGEGVAPASDRHAAVHYFGGKVGPSASHAPSSTDTRLHGSPRTYPGPPPHAAHPSPTPGTAG